MPVIEGIEKFESKLRDLALTVQRKALIKAGRKGAELIRDELEARAPRLSGKLADEQIVKLMTSQNSATEITFHIGSSKQGFYGAMNEWGTAHMTAQPFTGPAFDAKVGEAIGVSSEEFLAAIHEVVDRG